MLPPVELREEERLVEEEDVARLETPDDPPELELETERAEEPEEPPEELLFVVERELERDDAPEDPPDEPPEELLDVDPPEEPPEDPPDDPVALDAPEEPPEEPPLELPGCAPVFPALLPPPELPEELLLTFVHPQMEFPTGAHCPPEGHVPLLQVQLYTPFCQMQFTPHAGAEEELEDELPVTTH